MGQADQLRAHVGHTGASGEPEVADPICFGALAGIEDYRNGTSTASYFSLPAIATIHYRPENSGSNSYSVFQSSSGVKLLVRARIQ